MKKNNIFFPIILTVVIFCLGGCYDVPSADEGAELPYSAASASISVIAGVPTDHSVVLNVLTGEELEASVEYGTAPGSLTGSTSFQKSLAGAPLLFVLDDLQPDNRYFYRVVYKKEGERSYTTGSEGSFVTQRSRGSTFTFGVQGDSHPDRPGKVFNPALYALTLHNAVKAQPDFYFMLGDDFSMEELVEKKLVSRKTVEEVYLKQRQYLNKIGAAAALFLVNGNHDQAARYLLDGSPDSPAVIAALTRAKYFPLPVPDGFYGGDSEMIDNIGYLRDYYSFEWGDALFVVLDPYWHSDIPVDNRAGWITSEDKKAARDLWQVTLGDAQYKWFKETLENSGAKYKFVFEHHLLGTGRGGVENAGLFEWGGYNRDGVREFEQKRPGWELPIHDLMVKNGVTIFFQGHDHLFARQELDGVIYQTVPVPADNYFSTSNLSYYKEGDVLPASGFLKVTVAPEQVQVDYVKSFLPEDETKDNINGAVGYSYIVR